MNGGIAATIHSIILLTKIERTVADVKRILIVNLGFGDFDWI